MRNRVRIGLIAVAMTVAVAGHGCVTAPPPIASAIASGESHPVASSSRPRDAGAPTEPASAPAAASQVPPAAQTPDERRTALDKQLNDSLGAFDDRLKKEQEKISEERDARQATVATTTTPADGATDVPSRPRGRREREPEPSHAGALKSDKAGGGSGSASGNGATATIVPDGNDDDIVARRIRKAAEQETDPELKDKLWKEYVEYKKNSQVR